MYFVGFSIIVLIALLINNKVRPAVLFASLIFLYYLFDLITLEKMLHGFVNTSLVTLVLLLLVSLVFEKTTLVSMVSNKLFSPSYTKSLLKLSFFTSLFSAFLNNTAVVASMISVVNQNRHHVPSKLLLPLSYAAIFGGTMTLIGTSTNLLVNSFVIENGLLPLKLFDFIYVGLPIAIVGGISLLFIARFLPDIITKKEQSDYFIQAKVLSQSKLIGKSVKENGLRNLEYLYLSEIIRQDTIISPVHPNEIIHESDVLLFSGDVKQIKILERFDGLELEQKKQTEKECFVEVIVSTESILLNRTLKEANFRSKFNASVVAIKRGDQKLSGKMSEIRLQAGDNLVLAVGDDFENRDNLEKNFYLVNNNLKVKEKLNNTQSVIVLLGFVGVLGLSMFEIVPLIKGLFFLLACFLALKYVTFSEIKRRFPYELLIIIGSALGIATVMIESGLANAFSTIIQASIGSNVFAAFIAVYLLTFILTEVVTNNAAAALAFPIAYSTALSFDCSITPFIMAVAYGASASFILPYGYQTNLMVYSFGGYDMKTFMKSGVIISFIYSILVIVLIPLFFPF